MAGPIPLQQRIELAEAFVELSWLRVLDLPVPRSGIIEMARYQRLKAEAMRPIDAMLDRLLGMYDERTLAEALGSACETPEGI